MTAITANRRCELFTVANSSTIEIGGGVTSAGWLDTADRAIWGMVNMTVGSGSGDGTIVLVTPAGDAPSRASDLSDATRQTYDPGELMCSGLNY